MRVGYLGNSTGTESNDSRLEIFSQTGIALQILDGADPRQRRPILDQTRNMKRQRLAATGDRFLGRFAAGYAPRKIRKEMP